jgi:hypothetical protein
VAAAIEDPVAIEGSGFAGAGECCLTSHPVHTEGML